MGTQQLHLSRQRRHIFERQRRIALERGQELMLCVHAHAAFRAGDRVAVIDVREQSRFRKGLSGASGMHGDGFAAAEIAGQDDLPLLQGEYVVCAVSLAEKKLPGTQLPRLRTGNELAKNVCQHEVRPQSFAVSVRCKLHMNRPATLPIPPILSNKHYAEPSVFTAENLLREARRQKSVARTQVPRICVLDPDGDMVRWLV